METKKGILEEAKREFEHYCEGCSITDSCPAYCRGKWQAFLKLNEVAKHVHPNKTVVRTGLVYPKVVKVAMWD